MRHTWLFHRGLVCGCFAVAAVGIASATGPTPDDIHVRASAWRPGCELKEGQLEVWNQSSTYSYKVRVQGNFANPASGGVPQTCSGSGQSSTSCSTTFSENIELTTCGTARFCKAVENQGSGFLLPQCIGCTSGYTSCDNCDCDESGDWCVTFKDLEVKVTYWSDDGETWEELDEVVCTRGSFGTTDLCEEESYCDEYGTFDDACDSQAIYGCI